MKETCIRAFGGSKTILPFAKMLIFVLILMTVNVCFAGEMQTRFGKISIVVFDKQGNKLAGNGIMDEYKRIQYLLNDKVIHEEIDEVFGQPIPELLRVFKQSKSDAVFVLSDSGGQLGLCALQVISVKSNEVEFSNIYTDGQGNPTFSQKGDTIAIKFKGAKPVKTILYSNGKLK